MSPDLDNRLRALAEAPILLIAADYDGTLAPLVDDPASALPHAPALRALTELAALDHTYAAIISGRSRAELARLSGAPAVIPLVGSHGAETDEGHVAWPAPETLDELEAAARAVAAPLPGILVERKPLAVALHYRAAGPAEAEAAVNAFLALARARPALFVRHGSKVVELCLSSADKGGALQRLRFRSGATSVLFIGDDLTDEDALRTLGPGDVGVRVGTHEHVLPPRVPDVAGVADLLARTLAYRRAFLAARVLTPLEHLSMLSDQRTLAMVDPRGRIVWYCLPRADSSSVFAALLGSDAAGSFDIAPLDPAPPPTQRYEPSTFLLTTEWTTPAGSLRVTDYLDCSGGRAFQRAGRSDLIRVVSGTLAARVRFAPRGDYARAITKIRPHPQGLEVEGTTDPLVLHCPGLEWTIHDEPPHHTAHALLTPERLAQGDVVLDLRSGLSSLRESVVPEPERRRETARLWTGWAAGLKLPALHPDAVRRSALVLKGLCHGPTGAILAAGTTSLPEQIGGVRNWDYRFCWPRDACLAAAALVRLGNSGHAIKMLDWLLGVVDSAESPERLRPIYTVSGRHLPPEAEITALPGYGASRPVRVNNAASTQVQLDVFGPIVDLVDLLTQRGSAISPDHWRLVKQMVQAVGARWREPDHGIWEIRAERRHHTHSKVMCWLTVDRALRIQEALYAKTDPEWQRLRDEIAADVLAHAWNEQAGAFTIAYGSPNLDAAALWTGLSGLVAPTDERFVRTVDAVNARLRVGPVVYRYLEDDGLPGKEGGMLICAGWLAEALHRVGRAGEARELLEGMVGLLGPTLMAPEQYDPRHRCTLGNTPQAYSHLAIINAAVALS